MSNLLSKLNDFKQSLVDKGIPIPFISDKGSPSVSLTLLISSFVMWCLGITEIIKNMDISKCENMVMVCASLYFGRKLTKDNNNKLIVDSTTNNPNGEGNK